MTDKIEPASGRRELAAKLNYIADTDDAKYGGISDTLREAARALSEAGEPVAWKVQIGAAVPGYADEWWQVEFRIKEHPNAIVTPLYAAPNQPGKE